MHCASLGAFCVSLHRAEISSGWNFGSSSQKTTGVLQIGYSVFTERGCTWWSILSCCRAWQPVKFGTAGHRGWSLSFTVNSQSSRAYPLPYRSYDIHNHNKHIIFSVAHIHLLQNVKSHCKMLIFHLNSWAMREGEGLVHESWSPHFLIKIYCNWNFLISKYISSNIPKIVWLFSFTILT